MNFAAMAKWWMEIRRIEPTTVMVETVALAIVAAAVLILGSELVVEPIAHRIWPEPEHL